jgi:hypothetical protein
LVIAGLAVGTGAGVVSVNPKVADLRADLASTRERVEEVEGERDGFQSGQHRAESAAAEARTVAAEAQSVADAKAKVELDAALAKVAEDRAALKAEKVAFAAETKRVKGELAEREKAVGIAEVQKEANSFGNGVHVVGVDIRPGTYRTDGAEGCYWAKLRQDEDIIDNDWMVNGGRTTVTITSSVYKFESNDCGTWTRVG